jgi:hypothetical protein
VNSWSERNGLQGTRPDKEQKQMSNQHAELSQTLAAQRITERQDQAAQARLARAARPPRRRRRAWVVRRWWQLARWPAVTTDQPVSRPQNTS